MVPIHHPSQAQERYLSVGMRHRRGVRWFGVRGFGVRGFGVLSLISSCAARPLVGDDFVTGGITGIDSGPGAETGIEDMEASPGVDGSRETEIPISVNRDVDILFVIDNSGSMGEEQRNLSENFGNFLAVLEADDVAANYRIGITTTDNGNPWCSGGTHENGNLVLSSCRSRIDDFVTPGIDEDVDQTAACLDVCPPEFATIELRPTSTATDDQSRARPWLENLDGVTNLPELPGLTTTQALQCFGPQGINGCGFEQHLESMYLALIRANTDDEPSYGFLRDAAILAIVFVTDEEDCSYNDDYDVIFIPENREGHNLDTLAAFWRDPSGEFEATAIQPTSAVCWNAGVQCEGQGIYSSCDPVNLDEVGQPVSEANAETQAVLRPISRYIDLVSDIERSKQALNADQDVLVTAISGVPVDYPNVDIVYSESPGAALDVDFVPNFGVGPGCVSRVAEAVPPVRLRDFAEAFGENNLFSVCSTDFGPSLQATADKIRDQIRPACFPACAADVDVVAAGLQPQCTLVKAIDRQDGSTVRVQVPQCEEEQRIPAGYTSCHVPLTVPSEMDRRCVEDGWNLEFRFIEVPDPNHQAGATSSVNAICELSSNRVRDCPGLPG